MAVASQWTSAPGFSSLLKTTIGQKITKFSKNFSFGPTRLTFGATALKLKFPHVFNRKPSIIIGNKIHINFIFS